MSDLVGFAGVGRPRSGHHLLGRLLTACFGSRFSRREFHTPVACCEAVPPGRRQVAPSVNHDCDSSETFPERPRSFASGFTPHRRLFIDITGMLPIAGQESTGIPRVHDFFIRSALSEDDRDVDLVIFDSGLGNFRGVSERETRHLKSDLAARSPAADGFISRLNGIRREIARNPYLDRRFDRLAASRAISGATSGFRFRSAKLAIRACRLIHKALFHRAAEDASQYAVDLRNGTIVLSNASIFTPVSRKALPAAGNCAFICHDTIPSLFPEFATEPRQVERFVTRLGQLLRGGAKALCTSETSLAMLRDFIAATEIGPVTPPGRFPLPSSLHGKFEGRTVTSPHMPDRPFVLYCSTIEIRKNHLLLARVWKKARDEGISMPLLLCVGGEGWKTKELHGYLRATPEIAGDIRFTGPLPDEDLAALYGNAEFAVMPSLAEGWGYGVSEPLDFGLPVIASTAVSEATRGLMPVLDPDDVDAWLHWIRRLSEDKAALQSLRDRIAHEYRPVREAESWARVKAELRRPASSGAIGGMLH